MRILAVVSLSLVAASLGLDGCTHYEESPTNTDATASAPPAPVVQAQAPAPAKAAQAAISPALLKQGAAAYERGQCAKCHGADGTGGQRAPNLTDSQWLQCDGSVAGIRAVLVSGVPHEKVKDASHRMGMNSATKLVPEADLTALATYVQQMSKKK